MDIHEPEFIFLETLVTILFPVLMLTLKPGLVRYRHILMCIGGIYVIVVSLMAGLKTPLSSMYIPDDVFPMLSTFAMTIMASIFLVVIHRYHNPEFLADRSKIIKGRHLPKCAPLVLYPLLSVPLQEILFRWFVLGRLQGAGLSDWSVILVGSLIFGLVHIPFGKPALALGTFILGLWWNSLYVWTGNMWYSLISHAILGNTLIYIALYNPKIRRYQADIAYIKAYFRLAPTSVHRHR